MATSKSLDFCYCLLQECVRDKKKNHWLNSFFKALRSAYIVGAKGLLKLPLLNKNLTNLSCLDPGEQRSSTTKPAFMELAEHLPNVVPESKQGQLDGELRKYTVDGQITNMDVDETGPDFHLDTDWWAKIFTLKDGFGRDRYPVLTVLVKALMSIFTGPAVEGTFNIMGDIITEDRTSLTTFNYEALAVIKRRLQVSGQHAVTMNVPQKMKESVQESWKTYQEKLNKNKNENQYRHHQSVSKNEPQPSTSCSSAQSEEDQSSSSSRKTFFHILSQKLETAATTSFYDLQCVARKAEHAMAKYEVSLHHMNVKHYLTDTKAAELIPKDSLHLTPIKVFGDGNCLPRCCSLLAFGSQDFYEEMRARIVVELSAHRDFYLDSKNLEGVPVTSATCSDSDHPQDLTKTYASYSDHFNLEVLTPGAIRQIFEAEVCKAAVPGSYMGIWQVHAVASILQTEMQSLYPEYGGQSVRKDLHKTLLPRNNSQLASGQEQTSFPAILWSRVNGKDLPEVSWRPNHFVVCLPRGTDERQAVLQPTPEKTEGKKRKVQSDDIRAFFVKRSKNQ